MAFSALYRDSCSRAIQTFTQKAELHEKFLHDVEQEFSKLFISMDCHRSNSAGLIHTERLQELSPLFKHHKSQNSCLCCLLRTPEKVLDCGHAYCDTCIRTFGTRSASEQYVYMLPQCLLCSRPHLSHTFSFTPPTAGVRILTIDGGGVRGIIPLTVLRQLEADLEYLGCPLRDHFDFVVGTSSGLLLLHSF